MRFVLIAGLAAVMAAAAGVWWLPIELFQTWNIDRAGSDPYAQFEAAGQAEFLTWLARLVLPLLGLIGLTGLRFRERIETSIASIGRGWLAATGVGSETSSNPSRWRTSVVRGGVVFWLGLFVIHAAQGMLDRGRDWAYFRFNSGEQVLPNISFENRSVIRFLRQATPPDARILICSDQSVFFLSYYLRPRQVFHVVHPRAEFVIPQAGQTRPLFAYRWSDIPAGEVTAIRPDYVLEYFEGPSYVDPQRLRDDASWIRYRRESEGDNGSPTYLVELMTWEQAMPRRPDLAAQGQPRE